VNIHKTKVPMNVASQIEVSVFCFVFNLCNSPDSFKKCFIFRLCSCLLFLEGRSSVGKRTAGLWTSVETGVGCVASRALCMDPLDSLLLLSGAS